MLVAYFISGFIALASATTQQDALFAALLKRQEPGTPAFACHEACGMFNTSLVSTQLTHPGTAVTLSKGGDACQNTEFTTRYNDCLKCAGPDNVNIWRYYGGTLGKAGAACGLDTQPGKGSQSGASSATQVGSQVVSSSAVAVSSGTAVLSSGSSVVASATLSSSSGRVTSSSTSGVVSPSPGSSTAVSLPCFCVDLDNDCSLDCTGRGIDKCRCCNRTGWGRFCIGCVRSHLRCGAVWHVNCLPGEKRWYNRRG
jgi:hypothetical protein